MPTGAYYSTPGTTVAKTSAMVLRELSGPQRVLKLLARALPFRGVGYTGKMRVDLTWYPGNPFASAQVLGPEEATTTMRGRWSDRLLSDKREESPTSPSSIAGTTPGEISYEELADEKRLRTDLVMATITVPDAPDLGVGGVIPLSSARDLAYWMDELRYGGQLLEVSWGAIGRRGFLTSFTQTWQTLRVCEWEVEFTWISREGAPVAQRTSEVDLSQKVQRMSATSRSLTNQSRNLRYAADQAFVSSINQRVATIASSVRSMENTVLGAQSRALGPVDAVRRSLGLLGYVAAVAGDLIETIYSKTAESASQIDLLSFTYGKALIITVGNRRIARQARQTRHLAAGSILRLSRATEKETQRVYFGREGEDLRDVSRRYYGDQSGWRDLLRFNSLTTSRLSAGQVVLVPLQRRDRDRGT